MTADAVRHSFVERVVGIALLDPSMVEEIKKDPAALKQAAIMVIAVPLIYRLNPWANFDERTIVVAGDTLEAYTYGGTLAWTLGIALGSVAIAFFAWVFSALAFRFVALRLLGSPSVETTWAQVARPLGFTVAVYLLGIGAGIAVIGFLVSTVLLIWTTAIEVVILSQIFQISTWRTFATVIVTWVVALMLIGLLYCVLVSHVGRPSRDSCGQRPRLMKLCDSGIIAHGAPWAPQSGQGGLGN
jgi:hypothetical protein